MQETESMEQGHLDALLSISQEINSIKEIDPLLNKVMDIAMKALSAERGVIVLLDGTTQEMSVKTARNISDEIMTDTKQVSSSVITHSCTP